MRRLKQRKSRTVTCLEIRGNTAVFASLISPSEFVPFRSYIKLTLHCFIKSNLKIDVSSNDRNNTLHRTAMPYWKYRRAVTYMACLS